MADVDDAVQKMLQAEVRNGIQSACVSDTLEGLIGKTLEYDFNGDRRESGHGLTYWDGNGGKAVTIPDEFFSKYCQVNISNMSSLAFMNRAFPESMKFVSDMLGEM